MMLHEIIVNKEVKEYRMKEKILNARIVFEQGKKKTMHATY